MHNISWRRYITLRRDKGPRPLLVEAAALLPHKGIALDLGAGALADTRYLLEQGFSVIALDTDEASAEIAATISSDQFTFLQTDLTDYTFLPSTYDLVNAQYVLPFIDSEKLYTTVDAIITSLKPQGVFTGQIQGDKDAWSIQGNHRSFLTRAETEKLFATVEILKLEEEETDKETALGVMKHWHTLHFIVRKP